MACTGLTAPGGEYLLTLTAGGSGVVSSASGVALQVDAADAFTVTSAQVAGRHVFYNQSRYDGNTALPNANDDGAIATDKVALLPGQTATLANYTSYSRGINGLMVDIAGLAGSVTAGDFEFKVGNSNTTSGWATLATAPTVSIRAGAGAGGSSRVTLIWPNSAIVKQWLQVTVKANGNTGLATPDVFYFGNAIGEAGNSAAEARVTISDEVAARNNAYSGSVTPTPITSKWDYNRDGSVSVQDQTLARNNQTTTATRLQLITVPSGLSGSGLVAQGLGDAGSDSDLVRGLALRGREGKSPAEPGSSAGGTASGAVSRGRSLQPQALSAAYGEGDGLLGKRRAAATADVESDLLELLSSR